MIASLRGVLQFKSALTLIIEVNGVGYEVFYPASDFNRVPEMGKEVFLHIYTCVREDSLTLYGFCEVPEKEMFLLLLGVSGIGPKLALNIISGIRPAEFGRAITTKDIPRLTGLNGIGKKTAERMCLELKDKIEVLAMTTSAASLDVGEVPDIGPGADVISALVNLGYSAASAREALAAVRRQLSVDAFEKASLADLIRQTLRSLA